MKDNQRLILGLIIFNEFCERYSFYSIKSILYTFMIRFYKLSPENAKWIVHLFVFSSYFSAIFGGLIADLCLGRFKTILFFNFIYLIGNSTIVFSCLNQNYVLSLVGLVLVASGAGGIKPCVSAFGGDQTSGPMDSFFGYFYISINIGSLLGLVISPLIAEMSHTAITSSYFYTFVVSTAVHMLSVLLFISGTKFYRKKNATICSIEGNIVNPRCYKALLNIKNLLTRQNISNNRSLEGDNDNTTMYDTITSVQENSVNVSVKHGAENDSIPVPSKKSLNDIQRVYDILQIFIYVPSFWMLYDQQSSTWIEQGLKMKRSFTLFEQTIVIIPSQMQSLNAILVLIFIPLTVKYIYPFAAKYEYHITQLQKIYIGMFICTFGFIISGVIEFLLLKDYKINLLWQIPQYIFISFAEVLVSITGLEFSYSQAPEKYRSLIFSMWLLTTAFGNLFILIFSSINPFKNSLPNNYVGFLNMIICALVGIFSASRVMYLAKSFKYTTEVL